jgi:hypothetical protein
MAKRRRSGGGITRQCCGRPRVASKFCLWYSVPWRVALPATERHPLARTKPAMSDGCMQLPGSWYAIDVVNGADRLTMLLRTDRPSDADIDDYSTSVVIKWEYPRREGTAEPPDDVRQRMIAFELAVAPLSFGNGLSHLMNRSTGLGLREWCYYTKDGDRFMHRFNKLLEGHERYPLAIEFYDDPEWKVWLDLRYAYERFGGKPTVRANPPLQRIGAARILSGVRNWLRRGPDC